MHSRTVLTILSFIFLTGFSGPQKINSDFEGGDAVADLHLSASKDVVGDVNNRINQLPELLAKVKNPEDKIKYIKDTVAWAEALRKASGVQTMSREVSLDYIIEPLKVFSEREYRADNCPYFKTYINSQYEPSEDGEVTNPSLKRAQRVIASVCP